MTDPQMGCSDLREVAAELAVGSLSGDERAAAVSHLAGCQSCQQLMGELTGIADDLLLMAPEIEPPPGFESRVLTRLSESSRVVEMGTRRRSRLRSLVAIAACVILGAIGGAVTAQVIADDDSPQQLRTALALSSSGNTTCRVVVTTGEPASLLISLDNSQGRTADYVAEAQPEQGAPIPLGRFAMSDGHGMLAKTLDIDGADVASIRVFSMDGELLYEAFPGPTESS